MNILLEKNIFTYYIKWLKGDLEKELEKLIKSYGGIINQKGEQIKDIRRK